MADVKIASPFVKGFWQGYAWGLMTAGLLLLLVVFYA